MVSAAAALQSLSTSGVFASRAFLPAFLVALLARFPELLTWLPFVHAPPVVLSDRLAWLASDPSLLALAVLALAEGRVARSPELRELFGLVEPWLKGALAAAVAFGLLDGEATTLLGAAGALGDGARPSTGALGLGLLAGVATVAAASLRRDAWEHVDAVDPDDAVGLRGFAARLDDGWAIGGTLLVVLAPILALGLAALGLASLALARRRLDERAERLRVPCAACDSPCRREASRCPTCGVARSPLAPAASAAWPDRWLLRGADHGLELIAGGRCPACAERRDTAEILRGLPCSCGWAGEPDPPGGWPAALDAHVGRRAIRLAVACAALGLVPVLGAVVALVTGRVRIAGPYRRALPFGRRIGARWLARLGILALLLGSGIPLVSALLAPAIVGVQLLVHRRAFRGAWSG